MAKQSGIHQLRGKIRGMSYYGQKGVQDGLVRKINEGLSTRVKNDAAYANTRLNAAEFGTAGSFAGAAIRSISERKRAMMKDFATGDLAKVVRAEFLKDDTHVWGKRQFVGATWRDLIGDKLNQYAKLPWSDYVGGVSGAAIESGDSGLTFSYSVILDSGWGSLLAAKGATSAQFDIYFVAVSFDASGDAPYRSSVISHYQNGGESNIGSGTEFEDTYAYPTDFPAPDGDNAFVCALVVVKPMKEIGSQKYILQELCTYDVVVPEVQE